MDTQEALYFLHRGLITWNMLWFFIAFFDNTPLPVPFWKLHLPTFTPVLEILYLGTRKRVYTARKWNSPKGLLNFRRQLCFRFWIFLLFASWITLSAKTPILGDSNNNFCLESLLMILVRMSSRRQGIRLYVGIIWCSCSTSKNKGYFLV